MILDTYSVFSWLFHLIELGSTTAVIMLDTDVSCKSIYLAKVYIYWTKYQTQQHRFLFGLTQSEKTSVMTTPKCQGAHFWQI